MMGVPSPAERATRFLRLVEERRLVDAEAMVGPGCAFTYPGGCRYTDLRACVADRSTRYRRIRKTVLDVHVAPVGSADVVYVSGTLDGEANDSTPISGVRFIDRLTFADDLLVAHDVWNDLAVPASPAGGHSPR